MRVYISGGPHRQTFSNGKTQEQIAIELQKINPEIEIVKGGKSDFIVIDDEKSASPSNTALNTGGRVFRFTKFKAFLKKTMEAHAETMQSEVSAPPPPCEITGELTCRCDSRERPFFPKIESVHGLLTSLFSQHAVYIMLFVKSVALRIADANSLKERLKQNAMDIGQNLARMESVSTKKAAIVQQAFLKHIAAIDNFMLLNSQDTVTKLFAQGQTELVPAIRSLVSTDVRLNYLEDDVTLHNRQIVELYHLYIDKKFDNAIEKYDAFYLHTLKLASIFYFAIFTTSVS